MKNKKYDENQNGKLLMSGIESPEMEFKNGERFAFGDGVEKNDEEASKWFTRAAEKGSVEAAYILACGYLEGCLGDQDYQKAKAWFEKAIKMGGKPETLYELGCSYFDGTGVKPDVSKAALIWEVAAEEGHHAGAQYLFGSLCYLGWGIEKDEHKGLELIRSAGKHGRDSALRFILGWILTDNGGK